MDIDKFRKHYCYTWIGVILFAGLIDINLLFGMMALSIVCTIIIFILLYTVLLFTSPKLKTKEVPENIVKNTGRGWQQIIKHLYMLFK